MPSLVVARCSKCGWNDISSSELCPSCGSKDLETVTSKGLGRVESFTVVRYPPSGFEKEAPYAVAIVRLEEGPVVIAKLKGTMNLGIGSEINVSSDVLEN